MQADRAWCFVMLRGRAEGIVCNSLHDRTDSSIERSQGHCHCSQHRITTFIAGARYPVANFWDLSNTSLRHLSLTGNQGTLLVDFAFRNILLFMFLLGWHYATSLKVAGSSPDEVDFFQLTYSFQPYYGPGSTQPLTEMSTRDLPVRKGLPALKADNLTAACEPVV
jgi:hypothetical protein